MNIYNQLPQLMKQMSHPKARAIGALGECVAKLMLQKSGYVVSGAHPKEKRGDLLLVEPTSGKIFSIEVKTARRSSDKRWHFLLFKSGKTDYRHADFVLLLQVLKSGTCVPFLIPVEALGERSQVCIGKPAVDYVGMWAKYRQNSRNIRLECDVWQA